MDKLTSIELRILGALVEKQVTTPDYYPMTLNALINACNQKNNRHPVVQYSEMVVETGLDSLRRQGLAKKIIESSGRATKFSHDFAASLRLDRAEVAVMTELMLRGPQTPGELRQRASRLFPFADLATLEAVLERLSTREAGSLVVRLPRQAGSREARFAHLLGDEPLPTGDDATDEEDAHASHTASRRGLGVSADRFDELQQEVNYLRGEVGELRAELTELRRRIGPTTPPGIAPPPSRMEPITASGNNNPGAR